MEEKLSEVTIMSRLREEAVKRGLTFVNESKGKTHQFLIKSDKKGVVGVVKRSEAERQVEDRLWVGVGPRSFLGEALSPGVTSFIIVVDQLQNRFVCVPLILFAFTKSWKKQHLSFYLSQSHGRYYLRRGKGDEPISLESCTDDFSIVFGVFE